MQSGLGLGFDLGLEGAEQRARVTIPDPDCLVLAPRDDRIVLHGYRVDGISVAFQLCQQLAGSYGTVAREAL